MDVQHEYGVNEGTKHHIIYNIIIIQCFFWVFYADSSALFLRAHFIVAQNVWQVSSD